MNTYLVLTINLHINFLAFHEKIKRTSFNLGLGYTLVIQKAYKVQSHSCVWQLWKYSCWYIFWSKMS